MLRIASVTSNCAIRPLSRTTSRSPMASASLLPVTCRKVTPSRSRMWRNPRRACACAGRRRARPAARRAGSGAVSVTRVRAKATRWRWPPEIWPTPRPLRPVRPTRRSIRHPAGDRFGGRRAVGIGQPEGDVVIDGKMAGRAPNSGRRSRYRARAGQLRHVAGRTR